MNIFHYRHRIIVFIQKYCKQKRMRYKRFMDSSSMPKCETCKHSFGQYECDRGSDRQLCVFTESSMYEPSKVGRREHEALELLLTEDKIQEETSPKAPFQRGGRSVHKAENEKG